MGGVCVVGACGRFLLIFFPSVFLVKLKARRYAVNEGKEIEI